MRSQFLLLLLCIALLFLSVSCESIGKFSLVGPAPEVSNTDAGSGPAIGTPGQLGGSIVTETLAPPAEIEKQLLSKGKIVAEVAAPYTGGWSLVGYSILSTLFSINRLIVANRRGKAIIAIDRRESSAPAREQVNDKKLQAEIDRVVPS